jgi:UDP-2,4-diacetamido-2,4,6-trideoxy-beta-L-altropyranose hydrolase
MKAVFRTDASLEIGTGHVMRCLTLAEVLRERGAHCLFICRSHPGNLIKQIRLRGFDVLDLLFEGDWNGTDFTNPLHAAWLGADWETDAEQAKVLVDGMAIDWLIVDHYALDARWEGAMASNYRKLMVIDDLADRPHVCNLLLDQTYGREAAGYCSLVPNDCRVLCGSKYALLRPEFAALRSYSLQRRARPALRELLITMGGVDKHNATGQVLQALRSCSLAADTQITVVMGANAPWRDDVQKQAQEMPWLTRVLVGVSDMAQLMADSDLAIGAAGATTWERCCIGLPTAMVMLAENQHYSARLLQMANAVRLLPLGANLPKRLAQFISEISTSEACYAQLRDCASEVTDGQGCRRVANWLLPEVNL